MEPLVIFGAFLVIYCGYLCALDSTRVWRRQLAAASMKRERAKKRAKPVRYVRSPRYTTDVTVVRTLLQRG